MGPALPACVCNGGRPVLTATPYHLYHGRYAASLAPPHARGLHTALFRSCGDVGFVLAPCGLGLLAEARSACHLRMASEERTLAPRVSKRNCSPRCGTVPTSGWPLQKLNPLVTSSETQLLVAQCSTRVALLWSTGIASEERPSLRFTPPSVTAGPPTEAHGGLNRAEHQMDPS